LLSGHKPRSQPTGAGAIAAATDKTVLITASPEDVASTSRVNIEAKKPRKGSKSKWIIAAALSLLAVSAAAVFVLLSSRPTPATLQIVGQYPFHSGHIFIWV